MPITYDSTTNTYRADDGRILSTAEVLAGLTAASAPAAPLVAPPALAGPAPALTGIDLSALATALAALGMRPGGTAPSGGAPSPHDEELAQFAGITGLQPGPYIEAWRQRRILTRDDKSVSLFKWACKLTGTDVKTPDLY